MKIVRIFTDIPIEDCHLWTVVYDGENTDEFNRIFDLWTDQEYLKGFFKSNFEDLATVFWKNMTIRNAVFKAIGEAEDFEDMIHEIEHGRGWNGKTTIGQIFQPLDNREYYDKTYKKHKAKPENKVPFLRLYAIRLAEDCYIITGGAIKLTAEMKGRAHLENELYKMELVKRYLKENEILYFEDLISN